MEFQLPDLLRPARVEEIVDGLHRYDVGELDEVLPAIRVPDGEPFPWGRTELPGLR